MKKRSAKQRNYNINFDALNEQGKELYTGIFQEFDLSSIYQLREVAKRMGVKSATTMDKKTLVTAMTELRVASTVYYPPKSSTVAPVTYQEVQAITDDYLMRSVVINPEKRKGILDFDTAGAWLRTSGFIHDDTDVFVPMLMVNDFGLFRGDEICGQVRFMEKCGRFGMFKIDQINGQNAASFCRKEMQKAVPPQSVVKIEKGSKMLNALSALCPICKGQRGLVLGLGALRLDGLAREISLRLSGCGFETINLFLDESPESMEQSMSLPGSSLVLSCENHLEYDDAIILAVSYAKRVAAYGRHIALILNNADVLKEETLREVYGAGRMTDSGSITSIVMSASLQLSETINRLSRTANSITIFKNNFTDEPLIDLGRSFSDSEKQLPSAEVQTLRDVRKQFGDQMISVRDFMAAYEVLLVGNKE